MAMIQFVFDLFGCIVRQVAEKALCVRYTIATEQ